MPRYGKPYFLKTYKKWRDDADRSVENYPHEPLDFPVRATVLFAVPRSRTSTLIVPQGDGDNFEKALYDFLQRKEFLLDDKWITTATWRKRFLPFGCEGYTECILESETEEIDIAPETIF